MSETSSKLAGWRIGSRFFLSVYEKLWQRQPGLDWEPLVHVKPWGSEKLQKLRSCDLRVLRYLVERKGIARRQDLPVGKEALRKICWRLRLALGENDGYDPMPETSNGFALTEIVSPVLAGFDPDRIDDLVQSCLEHTSYYRLPIALDMDDETAAIVPTLHNKKKHEMRFAPPPLRRARKIIHWIVTSKEKIPTSDPDYKKVFSAYLRAARDGYKRPEAKPWLVSFAKRDIIPVLKGDGTAVVRSFLGDKKKLEAKKDEQLQAYLLSQSEDNEIRQLGNNRRYNGRQFVLSDLKFYPNEENPPNVHLSLNYSDYFSYSLIADSAAEICQRHRLDDVLKNGKDGLLPYTKAGFQKFLHFGFGVAVIVHALDGDKIILTKRSGHNAIFKDAGFAMSAGEGLNFNDLCHPDSHKEGLLPFEQIVQRAVDEEMLSSKKIVLAKYPGGPSTEKIELWKLKERLLLLGALIYKPNLSCNLVFMLSVRCSAKQIRIAWEEAREGAVSADYILPDE